MERAAFAGRRALTVSSTRRRKESTIRTSLMRVCEFVILKSIGKWKRLESGREGPVCFVLGNGPLFLLLGLCAVCWYHFRFRYFAQGEVVELSAHFESVDASGFQRHTKANVLRIWQAEVAECISGGFELLCVIAIFVLVRRSNGYGNAVTLQTRSLHLFIHPRSRHACGIRSATGVNWRWFFFFWLNNLSILDFGSVTAAAFVRFFLRFGHAAEECVEHAGGICFCLIRFRFSSRFCSFNCSLCLW